jgi:hypothetical protein
MPVQTDFLVVQLSNGMPSVFPGHADHAADERFARLTRHKILHRCATSQEAHDIQSKMIKEGVAKASAQSTYVP